LKKLTSSPKDFFALLSICPLRMKSSLHTGAGSPHKSRREREREREQRAERGVRKASSFFPNFAPKKNSKKKE